MGETTKLTTLFYGTVRDNLPFGVCYGLLASFGAFTGGRAFQLLFDERLRAACSMLDSLRPEAWDPLSMLLSALLPPLIYCVLMYLLGATRVLAPLWGVAVWGLGFFTGCRVLLFYSLVKTGHAVPGLLYGALPEILLAPALLYVSLQPPAAWKERGVRHGKAKRGLQAGKGAFLLAVTAIGLIATVSTTLTGLYLLSKMTR